MSGRRDETFGEAYFTERSAYRKFEDYESALRATMTWYTGFMRLVLDELPPAPAKALDVGCGHGALVHHLARRGYDVSGLDTSNWRARTTLR